MYGIRSPAATAPRWSEMLANPPRARRCWRRATSPSSLERSRSTRSGSTRETTAPQCGSSDSASSAPLPQSMP